MKYTANAPQGFKYKLKRTVKKIVQPFRISEKDKGKLLYNKFLSMPVNDKFIFYEAFAGLGILDNPRAIFKYLLNQEDFKSYTHIWSVENPELAADNISEFSSLDNVIIVKRESEDYYKYLATSKYLINNSTFGYYFEKRNSQVYINTWHGVPTKYMGYEHTAERVENARGPARNFLLADYLVSANQFMTEVMYKRAYKLDGLFPGKILELGHPRSDAIVNANTLDVHRKLNTAGIHTDKKIILYAPTWKGTLYNNLDYNVEDFKKTVAKLSENIDTEHYRIYLRVHYFLYKILANDPELRPMLIPFTIDTNELLSVVDVLISDYSSIFFDFLATKKPILFYVPDLEEYQSGRGLYVPVSRLPGYVSSNINDISITLGNICTSELVNPIREKYLERYSKLHEDMSQWCIYNDDGNSCKRLVDVVFRREPVSELEGNGVYSVINGLEAHKEKILICVNTNYNDMTFYENLRKKLESYEYRTTDVTILTTSFTDTKYKVYFNNNIPKEVRVLVWYALPYVTKYNQKFFKREIKRSLGNVRFDEVLMEGTLTEYWAEFGNAIKKL